MERMNMAPYLAERLLCVKKGVEGINQVGDLFADIWRDPKVEISGFRFKLHYELIANRTANLNITISALNEKAQHKLDTLVYQNFPLENVRKDKLILRSIKQSQSKYLFRTELVSVNDKLTYQSLYEYFVKPLIFK